MRFVLLGVAVIIMLLLYMLTIATGHTSLLSDYFWWIFGCNALALCVLLFFVGRQLWQLWRDGRRRVFGSRIARRLVWMFVLVTVLPGLFLFGVSAQFIRHSINSWFGNETEVALERSLNLSKVALENSIDGVLRDAVPLQIDLARALTEQPARVPTVLAGQLKRPEGYRQLALWSVKHRRWLVRSGGGQQFDWPVLSNAEMDKLRQQGSFGSLESLHDTLYIRAWMNLPNLDDGDTVLFFRKPVPQAIAQDAMLIEAARAKYADLSYAQKGLQTFFLMTLLMATLLAMSLALVLALYFSRRFVAPLSALADGTRAVAQGDFSRKSPVLRADEMGMLSSLFNRMTKQLDVAQQAAEQNRLRQEAARVYLEQVLASLMTGVLALDEQGRLRMVNDSAEQILGLDFTQIDSLALSEWEHVSSQWAVWVHIVNEVLSRSDDEMPVQMDYIGQDQAQILLLQTGKIVSEQTTHTIIVFDDVTDLVQAQKEAAWGEVAKRLAHEIRNPLTPIQLSAERLAWKLQDKLNEDDARILIRSTDTIVKQVAALKEMVEAFRNYARSPALRPVKQDLRQLVAEVLLLYEGANCQFKADLGKMALIVRIDTSLMRQVLHNVFKNAAEAAEEGSDEPQVCVKAHLVDNHAVLVISNNGKSFEPNLIAKAFEPYVTDKKNGTGLGLAVVKKIIDDHQGKVMLANREEGGAIVRILLPKAEE